MTRRTNHEHTNARVMLAVIILFFGWPFVASALWAW